MSSVTGKVHAAQPAAEMYAIEVVNWSVLSKTGFALHCQTTIATGLAQHVAYSTTPEAGDSLIACMPASRSNDHNAYCISHLSCGAHDLSGDREFWRRDLSACMKQVIALPVCWQVIVC